MYFGGRALKTMPFFKVIVFYHKTAKKIIPRQAKGPRGPFAQKNFDILS
jgi:hypothetical protein